MISWGCPRLQAQVRTQSGSEPWLSPPHQPRERCGKYKAAAAPAMPEPLRLGSSSAVRVADPVKRHKTLLIGLRHLLA